MFEQEQEREPHMQHTLRPIDRFRISQVIERYASWSLLGFIVFVWYVSGLIIGWSPVSAHFSDWMYLSGLPWFAIWTIITIIGGLAAIIFLARYQKRQALADIRYLSSPVTDPVMPTTRPPLVQETKIEVVEGELV